MLATRVTSRSLQPCLRPYSVARVSAASQLFPEGGEPGVTAGRGTVPYTVLDVFANEPIAGNPVAIFFDGRGLTDEEMQKVAREMNLSETVFLFPPEGEGDVRIRMFTPNTELPFTRHPVLGAAFVVSDALRTGSVVVETQMGAVPVDMTREGARLVFGRMSQPIPTPEPYEWTEHILESLGVTESVLPVEAYRNGPHHVLVMLDSAEAVASLDPDFRALSAHPDVGTSCFARDGDNWKTRMFAPSLGVNEDPGTGSAAGPIALHLARHGEIAFGEEIELRQGVEIGRPSVLKARVIGTVESVVRVEVGGSAVTVAQGNYLVRNARTS